MSRPVFKAEVDMTGNGTISIDGHDISNAVSGFTVVADVAKVTEVHLKLIGTQLDLEIEGLVLAEMPQKEVQKK